MTAGAAALQRDAEGCFTHRGATHKDDDEGAKDPSYADHPGHAQEEDHAKNILDAGQVHAHQSAKLWCLGNTKQYQV